MEIPYSTATRSQIQLHYELFITSHYIVLNIVDKMNLLNENRKRNQHLQINVHSSITIYHSIDFLSLIDNDRLLSLPFVLLSIWNIKVIKNNEKKKKRTLTKKLLDSSCCLHNIFSTQEVKIFHWQPSFNFLQLLSIGDRKVIEFYHRPSMIESDRVLSTVHEW